MSPLSELHLGARKRDLWRDRYLAAHLHARKTRIQKGNQKTAYTTVLTALKRPPH